MPSPIPVSVQFKLLNRVSTAFFCFVLVLVLINTFSPLRLNIDSIRYLRILEVFKGGLTKNSDAAHDFLPHGYPWLLYLLDKFQALNSFSITLINIVSILISSYLFTKILNISNP